MANHFDQFDEQKKVNHFDQFDEMEQSNPENPYSVNAANYLIAASKDMSLSEPEFEWDKYGPKTKALLGTGQVAGVYGGATHLGKGYNIGKEIVQKGRGAWAGTGLKEAASDMRAAKTQLEYAHGVKNTARGLKSVAGAGLRYLPAVDVAFAAHGAYDDINNPEGRGAAYGGGFWNGLGGSLEGAANGLTAGGYDAVRSFNFGKKNKYSQIGTVNPDPLGSGKLAEKYAQKFFDWYSGNSKPAQRPSTLTEQL